GVNSVTQYTNASFTTSGSSVFSETVTATDCSSFYQAGQYAGGSFSLASVAYAETFTAQFTYQGGDTQTAAGAQTQTDSGRGNGTGAAKGAAGRRCGQQQPPRPRHGCPHRHGFLQRHRRPELGAAPAGLVQQLQHQLQQRRLPVAGVGERLGHRHVGRQLQRQ